MRILEAVKTLPAEKQVSFCFFVTAILNYNVVFTPEIFTLIRRVAFGNATVFQFVCIVHHMYICVGLYSHYRNVENSSSSKPKRRGEILFCAAFRRGFR